MTIETKTKTTIVELMGITTEATTETTKKIFVIHRTQRNGDTVDNE